VVCFGIIARYNHESTNSVRISIFEVNDLWTGKRFAITNSLCRCSDDSSPMIGVLDFATEMQGCRFSIGLRNSHDKSMRLAMTCGYRVFVCSNMAFSGDFTPVTM
jgi:hypothetical protein